MKVYLDDERQTPDGWIRVYWPKEAIELLKTGAVKKISLDHDLGDDARGTGYDVVLWIEEAVASRGFKPPEVKVHSANSSARDKMELGIKSIERFADKIIDEWNFNFGLYTPNPKEIITESKCEELLELMIEWAEENDLCIGGGYRKFTEDG